MNIKLLAVSIAAAACGTNAFAAEIYNSEGSTLSLGGYVDVGIGEYGSDDDVEVHQISPRINVGGTQDLGNGVIVDAKGEWALNYLGGGDTSFTTRLGYIGAAHENMGRFVVGTQWSPYYDVAGVADMPIAFANDFLYKNHGTLGSARADQMVSYRKGFSLAESSSINFGLGWQGEDTDTSVDARVQGAVSLDVMGIGLGYVYSGGEITVSGKKEDATSHVVSINYGSYGDGIYIAAVYGVNEYFFNNTKNAGVGSNLKDTDQSEFLLAYGMSNGLNISVNYENVEDDVLKTLYSQTAFQAEYSITPSFVTFAAYQVDLGDDDNTTKDDDKWTIGARYFL
ncbi:porin [Vibrio tubiashii]|uniref:Porin n=1 Tax=Vibrio tubiashii TaxID=29498 RepID=A0AAE5GM47_9VIBR|nr:porin [Vibrio tubiashii]NOI79374.1 porin [Vibrio tubiashii]